MSTIIWVLQIVASGMYGMPVPIQLTFENEVACETARATVTTQRTKDVTTSCEPKKIKKENK